jgi:hypothetical protein
MRFAVPQFIDVEDKIFGPLTFRQFVYLAGGGGLAYVLYKIVPGFFGIVAALPVAVFAVALAFVKVNEKPFINIIEAAFNYMVKDKLYIWKHNEEKKKADTNDAKEKTPQYLPRISESKLHDIAWGLNVLDKR